MDHAVRNIPDVEFAENFSRELHEMASAVAFSGLTISEIARATRVKWDTVYAVSQCRPVRIENASRIRYFLNDHKERKAKGDG